jgi:hypothetical protein
MLDDSLVRGVKLKNCLKTMHRTGDKDQNLR